MPDRSIVGKYYCKEKEDTDEVLTKLETTFKIVGQTFLPELPEIQKFPVNATYSYINKIGTESRMYVWIKGAGMLLSLDYIVYAISSDENVWWLSPSSIAAFDKHKMNGLTYTNCGTETVDGTLCKKITWTLDELKGTAWFLTTPCEAIKKLVVENTPLGTVVHTFNNHQFVEILDSEFPDIPSEWPVWKFSDVEKSIQNAFEILNSGDMVTGMNKFNEIYHHKVWDMREFVLKSGDNVINRIDGTKVCIPMDALDEDTEITITSLREDILPLFPGHKQIVVRKIKLNGVRELREGKRAEVILQYTDANNDGIVDNTGVSEDTLGIFYLDEAINE